MPALLNHVTRQGDRALVLAQRLLQQITHAPEIEEDMALANVALDLLGQARYLYTYAGEVEGLGHDEDHFAYWREPGEFANPLLVEQPNTDFAHVIVRQYLHDEFAIRYWDAMTSSVDATLAALAGKTLKETTYHLRHSRGWVLRLGDGTSESHDRAQAAFDHLVPFTGELFACSREDRELAAARIAPLPSDLLDGWFQAVSATTSAATLATIAVDAITAGDDRSPHDDDFVDLIGEMQVLARAHPGATW